MKILRLCSALLMLVCGSVMAKTNILNIEVQATRVLVTLRATSSQTGCQVNPADNVQLWWLDPTSASDHALYTLLLSAYTSNKEVVVDGSQTCLNHPAARRLSKVMLRN
ncbi:hypothetical protein [Pseudoalteromonas ardens]|uniref:Ig-like domain-containing protein n=1 Tax=Pseudoalteromonas rubra TaxID=43658 RepID=A0A0L0EMB0_9GAMM|nr:hypothetical protein [Pseudoalteromonas sp. R96]KNC65510.1 hypothetical protein AC626_22670 [Pseudoalteromonas rubra]MDK1312968.1 hypothetical protein [Pseudoalteromonas sp. R96]